MSHKELVARLRRVIDLFNNPDPLSAPWARETASVICMREAADAIEALEQREAWWKELFESHWSGSQVTAKRAAELRRLLGEE